MENIGAVIILHWRDSIEGRCIFFWLRRNWKLKKSHKPQKCACTASTLTTQVLRSQTILVLVCSSVFSLSEILLVVWAEALTFGKCSLILICHVDSSCSPQTYEANRCYSKDDIDNKNSVSKNSYFILESTWGGQAALSSLDGFAF